MAGGPLQEHVIRSFGVVSSLRDSTETEPKVNIAKNIRGRPLGSITGPPLYDRFCQTGVSQFMDAVYFALTYPPFGGSPRALVRATDKTIAIDVSSQGKHVLVLYALNAKKCRGIFYLGDDGTFSGTLDLVGGSASMQVLAVGLDENARWHGSNYYDAWAIGNGVNPNAVVQLNRTALAPGKWRNAGSNQRPATPVIRQVVPTAANNVQATWTIPGTARFNFDSNAYRAVTANVSTDTFTKVASTGDPFPAHGLVAGDQVFIAPGGLTGPAALTVYYVIASGLTTNNFKVSATLAGAALNLTGAGASIGYLAVAKVSAPGHTFLAGDEVTLFSDIQLPGYLGAPNIYVATSYYIINPQSDQFGLSGTPGGTPIGIDTPGVGTNQAVAVHSGTNRLGPADLTFTANPSNFPGTLGDNIYVSITYGAGGYDTRVSSILTGSGTVSDPYHYALFTGSGFSATAAIVDFVNSDTNAVGILSASATVVDYTDDTQSWAFHELTGGVDATTINGVTVGFSDKTCSVYLRYWDPGIGFLGYEGISSDKSNVIVIDALSNYGIEISVAPNPTIESGRFGFIRAYLQFGEDVNAQWNLIAEVPNTVYAHTVTSDSALSFTANATANTITQRVGIQLMVNGDVVRFYDPGSNLPAPLAPLTDYYVVNAAPTTFQVSLKYGGSPINLTTAGSGNGSFRRSQVLVANAHPFKLDDVIQFTTTGTLPAELALNHNYYVIAVTADAFSVASTVGGQAIDIALDINAAWGSGTQTATLQYRKVQVGVETPIGQPMMVDQAQPLPSTLSVFSGGSVWHAGVTSQPSRIYPSKPATETELFPEGANTLAYEIISFPASVSGQKVTALYSDDQNLYVHSPGGIVYFPPGTPSNKTYPRVFAGAVTASALAVWTRNKIQYLGANLELFEQVQSNIMPLQSDFLALDAGAYVRNLVDLGAFAAHPDRCFMFSDERGQALYYWVPGLDGSLVGFQYDQLQKGILGPITYPKVFGMCKLEVGRPEYIFADEDANLFVWSSAAQWDYEGALPASSAFTLHTAGSAASTPSEAGFGVTAVAGGEYWKSVTCSMETGFLDLNKPGRLKAFMGAVVTSVQNSRAILTFTFTDMAGRTQVVSYNDIATKGIRWQHRVLCNLQGSAIKVKLDFIVAEMRPATLRDLTILFQPQGQR
jgi:hypothetical protein